MDFINSIKEIDTQLFLYLNSKHNSFFDVVMSAVSSRFLWIPLYLFFCFLIYKHFGKRLLLVMSAALLLIVLSDQISNRAFKNNFKRYRPCHHLTLQAQVHVNGDCGGTYGFVSSHATNTFALAMFLGLLFRKRIKYFFSLIFLWAAVVSYSRIYNGVHYPADVAGGAILGMLIGFAVYKCYQAITKRLDQTAHEK
jgi:undecaprenyl-diphosphatase